MPKIWPCTLNRHGFPERTAPACSNQATSRHTKNLTYRCFLPDLTGFISFCCVRPNLQRRLIRPDSRKPASNKGLNLAIAGCKLQGTATSPSSKTINSTKKWSISILTYSHLNSTVIFWLENRIINLCLQLIAINPVSHHYY